MNIIIHRQARYSEVPQIKEIANQHKYTKHFSHPAYCNRLKFEKGEIIVSCDEKEIIAFAALRIKKRIPETEIDIIAVDIAVRSKGIGKQLIDHICTVDKNPYLILNVMKDNPKAICFYERYGFVFYTEVFNGTAIRMRYLKPNNGHFFLK